MSVSPVVLSELAEQYADASDLVEREAGAFGPYSWPALFLACRALEYAFKTCLLLGGRSEKALKNRYGHDLAKMLRAVTVAGVSVSAEHTAAIHLANPHYRSADLSYPSTGYATHPPPAPLVACARDLLKQVAPALRQWRPPP